MSLLFDESPSTLNLYVPTIFYLYTFCLLFFLFVFSIIKLSSIFILRVFARKPHNFPLIPCHFTFLPKRIYLSASTNVEHWVERKCSLPAYLFLWFRSGEGVFYGRTIYVGTSKLLSVNRGIICGSSFWSERPSKFPFAVTSNYEYPCINARLPMRCQLHTK